MYSPEVVASEEEVTVSRHMTRLERRLLAELRHPRKNANRCLYFELQQAEEVMQEVKNRTKKNSVLQNLIDDLQTVELKLVQGYDVDPEPVLKAMEHIRIKVEHELSNGELVSAVRRGRIDLVKVTANQVELVRKLLSQIEKVTTLLILSEPDEDTAAFFNDLDRLGDLEEQDEDCDEDRPQSAVSVTDPTSVVYLLLVRTLVDPEPRPCGTQLVPGIALAIFVRSLPVPAIEKSVDILEDGVD